MEAISPGVQKLYFFQKGHLHGAMHLMEKDAQVLNVDKTNPAALAVLPTFCVKSIEDTLAKAEDNGGKTHV
jgi:predicted enzyme related to lactoylglutathione lyase